MYLKKKIQIENQYYRILLSLECGVLIIFFKRHIYNYHMCNLVTDFFADFC